MYGSGSCVSTLMESIFGEVGARVGCVRSVADGLGLHDIVAADALHRSQLGLLEPQVVGERFPIMKPWGRRCERVESGHCGDHASRVLLWFGAASCPV